MTIEYCVIFRNKHLAFTYSFYTRNKLKSNNRSHKIISKIDRYFIKFHDFAKTYILYYNFLLKIKSIFE